MNIERLNGIAEEIGECESLAELKTLWCMGGDYWDADFTKLFKLMSHVLRDQTPVKEVKAAEVVKPTRVARTNNNQYRLLKVEVGWSTKPQVHAVMQIIAAHAKVGDVLDEVKIVEMMVANEAVLQTRQGGKRIWDYYKGNHAEGLRMHGNVEKV